MTPILTQLKEIAGDVEGNWSLGPLGTVLSDKETGTYDTTIPGHLVGEVRNPANALHIATFNPETAGKLLEALRISIGALKEACDAHNDDVTASHINKVESILSTINLPTK